MHLGRRRDHIERRAGHRVIERQGALGITHGLDQPAPGSGGSAAVRSGPGLGDRQGHFGRGDVQLAQVERGFGIGPGEARDCHAGEN